MKTKIKNFAIAMDNAIEDVNKEYAIDEAASIGKDVLNAAICIGAAEMCAASAIIRTTRLTTRTVKTGAKKAIIVMDDYFKNSPAMTIYR